MSEIHGKVAHLPACNWWNGERIFPEPWLSSLLSPFIQPEHAGRDLTTAIASVSSSGKVHAASTERNSAFCFFQEETSWATNHNADLKKINKYKPTKQWHNGGRSGLCCSIGCGWNPGGGAGLRADGGSRSCSCPVSFCCDGACTRPDRGPGSPGTGPDALGCAASRRTCGCVPCAIARCGNSPPTSSGCGVRWKWNGPPCGCSVAFFGSAYGCERSDGDAEEKQTEKRKASGSKDGWYTSVSLELVLFCLFSVMFIFVLF